MTRNYDITDLSSYRDAVDHGLVADNDLTDYCGIQADLHDCGDPVSDDLLAELEALEAPEPVDHDVPF